METVKNRFTQDEKRFDYVNGLSIAQFKTIAPFFFGSFFVQALKDDRNRKFIIQINENYPEQPINTRKFADFFGVTVLKTPLTISKMRISKESTREKKGLNYIKGLNIANYRKLAEFFFGKNYISVHEDRINYNFVVVVDKREEFYKTNSFAKYFGVKVMRLVDDNNMFQ